jgi:hypothetical protein
MVTMQEEQGLGRSTSLSPLLLLTSPTSLNLLPSFSLCVRHISFPQTTACWRLAPLYLGASRPRPQTHQVVLLPIFLTTPFLCPLACHLWSPLSHFRVQPLLPRPSFQKFQSGKSLRSRPTWAYTLCGRHQRPQIPGKIAGSSHNRYEIICNHM